MTAPTPESEALPCDLALSAESATAARGGSLAATVRDGGERPFFAPGELAFAGWLRAAHAPQESAAPAPTALASPPAERVAEGAEARSEQPAPQGHPDGAGSRYAPSLPAVNGGIVPGKSAIVGGPARFMLPDEPAGAADTAAKAAGWGAGREFPIAAAGARVPAGGAALDFNPWRAAAPVPGSDPKQNPAANAPAQPGEASAPPADIVGQVAATSASWDGGADHQAWPDGAPGRAGDAGRQKKGATASPADDARSSPLPEAGAATRDEAISTDRSRHLAVEPRAADGTSSEHPSVSVETGSSGALRGPAADRRAPAPEAAPEPAPAPKTPARGITLRLSDGDQRVAVRLAERQGEVHVAVRTPDAGLAGDLRRDLPSLAARLEQGGFRAGTWQGGSEGRRPSGSDSSTAGQDANAGQGRQRGREGRDDPPRGAREAEEQIDPQGERKEFEWFISSHR